MCYVSVKPGEEELRMRLKEIAAVRPSWGAPRIHVLLRREGWPVNHKRTAHRSFSAHDVIGVLNRLSRFHRKPAMIQVDNGSDFTSRALDAWAYREDVRLDLSRPGKPTDNAHIESFNARLRAECLNAHVFESLVDAEETLTLWRSDYNSGRPRIALGMLTPKEFAELGQGNQGR